METPKDSLNQSLVNFDQSPLAVVSIFESLKTTSGKNQSKIPREYIDLFPKCEESLNDS
jgi:hypothetical protein